MINSLPTELRTETMEAVLADLYDALRSRGSALIGSEGLHAGLRTQAVSILEEVYALVERQENLSGGVGVAVEYGNSEALTEHGGRAAMHDVDPSEPLMAGEVLFHVSLPHLASELAHHGTAVDLLEVARALHFAIWRRFPPGAIAYVRVLRARLTTSYLDARRRVARDLHDRVGNHLVALAHQLDLADKDPAKGERVREELLALARDTQDFAFDLRQLVGERGLEEAIVDYAAATSYDGSLVTVRSRGVPQVLPSLVKEEVFAVVMEATRNAKRHAAGTPVRVGIHWREDSLAVSIADSGPGMTPTAPRHHHGLIGMRERVEALGGRFRIAPSGARRGVRILAAIPLR